MGKIFTKHLKYLLLLSRNKQDLNRYNPQSSAEEKEMLQVLEHAVKKERQKMYYSLLAVVLQYIPANNYPQKSEEVVEEEEEESPLEEADLEKVVQLEHLEEEDALARYTPLDEQRLQMAISYHGDAANEHFYDGMASPFPYEDGYVSTSPAHDSAKDDLSLTEEVHETMEALKYDFLESTTEISSREAEILAMYIAINPGEYALREALLNLSRDSNIGPM